MKQLLMKTLLVCLLTLGLEAYAVDHPQLKAFPLPAEGMQRFVIVLPHRERGEEEAFAVEIIAGRQMLTDGVNVVRLGSVIEARPLQGWGYTYYEVTGPDTATSTLMAPPPGAHAVNSFVAAAPLHIAYNSRLPIVVYAPQGYEIRYRIWAASEHTATAENG